MAVSIAALVSPLVKSAVLADVYTLLGRAFGQPLELDPGSPVAGILDAVVGWTVDDIWNPLVVPALQAPFLDYATGAWLSLIADLIYNRPRIEAQPGTQTVNFENRSTLGSVSAAAGTVRIKAVSGQEAGSTYTTTTLLTIGVWTGSGPYPTGTAIVQADVAGTASNAQAGDIGTFATGTPLVAGPVGCWVQSVAGAILGTDQETDANLVLRCRAAVSEVSDMGPQAEYVSIALDPVGAFTRRSLTPPASWVGGQVAVSRVSVQSPAYGIVNVYLASASGGTGGTMGDPTTDVGKVAVALNSFVVPPGTTLFVYGATTVTIVITSIVITLNAASNVTQAAAVATAYAGLQNYFETLPIGGARTANGGPGSVFVTAVAQACWGPGVVEVVVGGLSDTVLASTVVAAFAFPANPYSLFSANIINQGM